MSEVRSGDPLVVGEVTIIQGTHWYYRGLAPGNLGLGPGGLEFQILDNNIQGPKSGLKLNPRIDTWELLGLHKDVLSNWEFVPHRQ